MNNSEEITLSLNKEEVGQLLGMIKTHGFMLAKIGTPEQFDRQSKLINSIVSKIEEVFK